MLEGERKMSKSKHTEAQMIAAVKQMEAGWKAEDVAGRQSAMLPKPQRLPVSQ
jgi:hypothetical protein